MQLFLELKTYLKTLGIAPNKLHRFGAENVIGLILFVYCFGAMVIFLLFEPNITIVELGNVFFVMLAYLLNFSNLISNVIKQKKIFKLIENLEEIIKKSKFEFLP